MALEGRHDRAAARTGVEPQGRIEREDLEGVAVRSVAAGRIGRQVFGLEEGVLPEAVRFARAGRALQRADRHGAVAAR